MSQITAVKDSSRFARRLKQIKLSFLVLLHNSLERAAIRLANRAEAAAARGIERLDQSEKVAGLIRRSL
jgi:hypothetical protein